MPIPVRAIKVGFYRDARLRPGQEFAVESEKELGSWMERLDRPEPAKEDSPRKK